MRQPSKLGTFDRKALRKARRDAKTNGVDLTGLTARWLHVDWPSSLGVWAVWIDSHHRGTRPIWKGLANTETEAKVLGIYTRIRKKQALDIDI